MPLLFDEDYEYLKDCGLVFEEDEKSRYLVIRDFPLEPNFYVAESTSINKVDVLVSIPANYNTSGNDMFWVNPTLSRADGIAIPNIGGDPRFFKEIQFTRWSSHYLSGSWIPKVDNVKKLISRIEWAFKNPDAKR